MPSRAVLLQLARRDGPWLLVLSVLLLLPTAALFNIPMAIMALGGLVLIARDPGGIARDAGARLLLAVFACVWLPMLASLPDAANAERTALTVLRFLRLPLAGLFALWALRAQASRERLTLATFWVLLLWCADALWQFASGYNVLGYPMTGSRLSGIFYPKYRLGLVLAAASPLYFEVVRRWSARYRGAWLLVLPFCVVVVLSGSRNAWMMLGLSGLGYLVFLATRVDWRTRLRPWLGRVLLVALVSGVAASQYPGLGERIEATTGLLSADLETVDAATKQRVSIWVPALAALREHWVNGVGARGFRYVFADHAEANNYWLTGGRDGVTHPHQMLLEIAVDTGVLGVLGVALAAALLARALRRLAQPSRERALPASLCVLVAWFPLGAHMAFYGTYWSTVSWWLLYVCLAEVAAGAGSARRR